jgi:predicted ribosome quality control (RQC) complex YloA/Tae2 family protein
MPLDAVCLAALKNELSGQITGLKIDKVQQPEQDELLLTLRGFGAALRLLISAGTGDARLHLTEFSFENPANPPMFCMLLRKHLLGARITGITQPPMERAVDIALEGADALGDLGEKHLILELMGRYSNIILTGRDGIIIDCLRRVDSLMSERRQVLPGLLYRLPPVQDKRDPLTLEREEFAGLLKDAPTDKSCDKWLLDTFCGLSPLICRELVHRAYGDTERRIFDIMKTDSGASLIKSFLALTGDIRDGRFVPYMLSDQEGKPRDFSFTAISQYGGALNLSRESSFSALLEAYYTRRDKAERMRQRSSSMTKTVKTAHDRVRRKLELQREELKKTQNRERLRQFGDIITSNMYAMNKGMEVLRAPDYYSETGGEAEIMLDPMKTPQQNAAKYYKDYTKAKNAESFLNEQIRLGENELDYLKSVLEEIDRAESERDLSEIRQELAETGYLKKQKTDKKPGKKEKSLQSDPMRFRSSTGMDIRVGKNNAQNDALTYRTAYKTDVWLHSQKIHGSHVIISTNGGEADDTSLYEAASLAAYYSQARGSKKVPVDFCLAKFVKKPPGAKPGMAIYTDYRTVIAEPDEVLAVKLRIK